MEGEWEVMGMEESGKLHDKKQRRREDKIPLSLFYQVANTSGKDRNYDNCIMCKESM